MAEEQIKWDTPTSSGEEKITWDTAPKEKGATDYLKDYGKTIQRSLPYGVARGAITGTAGIPGEIEQFIPTKALPKTAVTAPLASTMLYAGREIVPRMLGQAPRKTAAPTMEDVSKGLTELGLPPAEGGWGKTGEFIGEVAPGAKGAASLLKAGVKATPLRRILPGATAEAERGLATVGEVSDKSTLGSKMKDVITQRLNVARKARSQEAEFMKGEYFKAGRGKEPEIIGQYNRYLRDQLTRQARNLAPQEKTLLAESAQRLGENPSIEAIEKELRRLKDIQGMPKIVEGYDAIRSVKAGDAAERLEKILNKLVPEGKEYRKAYQESSEIINTFDSLLGKTATGEFKDPAALPDKFFKSKETVRLLREFTNDEAAVQAFTRQHVANELKGLDAKQAVKWYNDNKFWLEEVKAVEKDARAYVDELEKVAKYQKGAKTAGLATALSLSASPLYYKAKSLFGF